ncbi:MAG: S8 family peptidase, partial [Lachnospiraceae bacterium]|nr:S8 family peptidase [Lachnospiraceae bacterium]
MDLLCREKILSNEYADWVIDFELTDWLERLDTSGVDYCYDKIEDTLGIVYAKRGEMEETGILNYSYRQIPSLLALPEIISEQGEEEFDFTPLVETGSIRAAREPLSLTGKNTVIALIGTGIDYTNPLFRKPDGSTRILAIWDQTIEGGNPPATAQYGSEYTRDQIDLALKEENPLLWVPTKEERWVTTYVAGVAAGSSIITPEIYTSPAPEAEFVVVKLKECKPYLKEYYLLPSQVPAYQSTDIIKAFQYADSFVREFFRPVIFCFTLGTNYGGHSGTTPLSKYLERLGNKRGRVVIVSGGAEGNKGHHYSGIFTSTQEKEKREEIEIRVGAEEKGFLAEIWGSVPGSLRVGIRAPSGKVLKVEDIQTRKGTAYRFIYEKTRIMATYASLDPGTGDQLIILRIEKPSEGIWTILIEGEEEVLPQEFHVWLPNTSFLSSETYFLKPDPDITLMVPCFTNNVICTSSYSTATNSFFAQSGRGFSRGSLNKPDLAAPAVGVSSPLRSLPGQLRIGRQTSTAFSAAFMAGAAAQFLQWAYGEGERNYLNGNEVKSLFLSGAKREQNRNYPNREWGYGRLSLQGVFDLLA